MLGRGARAAESAATGRDTAAAEARLYQRFAGRIELYGRRHLGASAARALVQRVPLHVLVAIRAGRVREPAALAKLQSCMQAREAS
ncbi:MAG TPA: hypothetical protein VFS67_31775 [Polyangiaceae bacterium]|nr:hypothetical protein [Polyangiaceae bacterium]